MQLKKNPRDSRFPATTTGDNFTEGVIPVGFEDEETNETSAEETSTETTSAPAEPSFVTRNREGQSYAAAPAANTESVIDGHSMFDGKFETDQDMRIQGQIAGEVVCRGRLTVEKEATARAKIQAHDAVIRGRVEGDVICSGRLDLASTAVLNGTIKAGTLTVEEGATIQGSVEVGSAIATTSGGRNGKRESGSEESGIASLSGRGGRRESPSFALVSSEERLAGDRN